MTTLPVRPTVPGLSPFPAAVTLVAGAEEALLLIAPRKRGRSIAPVPMYLYFPMRNITTRAGPLTFAPVYTIGLSRS